MKSKIINHTFKLLALIFTFSTLHETSYAEQYCTIIFYGHLKHAISDFRTHEGDMNLIGFSKELKIEKFRFDIGASTYVDTYHERSYLIFSNVSHQDYQYGIVTPMLVVGVTRKQDHDDSGHRNYPVLIPKLRFGTREGFFIDLLALPKIGNITNGWIGLEMGYKY